MNVAEAEQVIGRMLAGYPGRDMPPSSVAVFVAACAPYEFTEGLAAVPRVWSMSPAFLPGVGQWGEALQIEARPRRDAERDATRAALIGDMPVLSVEEWRGVFAGLRARIDEHRAKRLPPLREIVKTIDEPTRAQDFEDERRRQLAALQAEYPEVASS